MRPASGYEHYLLSEYASSLDSIPLDVAKSLADLRELDGVLNNAVVAFTSRLNALTDTLEDPHSTPAQRFMRLIDLAEHATQLKMGNDDKIRVATTTADIMQSQKTYLNDLLKAVGTEDGAFDPQRNSSKTVFPTLVFRPFANPSPIETGRRRRVQAANRNGPVETNPTPAKRKRANQDDADHRPAKEPVRRRGNSPTDSIMSLGSHMRGGQFPNGLGTPSVRSRPAPSTSRAVGGGAGLLDAVLNGKDYASPRLAHRGPAVGADTHDDDRAGGPSGPNAGSYANTPSGTGPPGGDDDGDVDAEVDEKAYCYCHQISYGDMVACDNEECTREWFHLPCIGMTSAPKGTWYCDDCQSKRDAKRARRGQTKRRGAGGARAKKPAGTPS